PYVATLCLAQGTEGLIAGHVTDELTGRALEDAKVSCTNTSNDRVWTARSNTTGLYTLPLLPPGAYRIRVEYENYQAKEQDEISLKVGGALELNFGLLALGEIRKGSSPRIVMIQQGGTVLDFYGP